MNKEWIAELRERAQLTLDNINDDEEPELWLFYRDLLAILDDYEKVKAECDEWEKAAKLWKDGNYRLQAELARYQPLIEAAERARKSTLTTDRIFWGTDILRAALAYKEKP